MEAVLTEKDDTIAALRKQLAAKSDEASELRKKLATITRVPPPPAPKDAAPAGTSRDSFEQIAVRLPHNDGYKNFVVRTREYTNIEHMGRDGTFGSLVSATRVRDRRRVIIKRQTIADIGNCETSLRELSCLVFLTTKAPHPNVIEILDCWSDNRHLYIVEDKFPGTLRDMVRKGPTAVTAGRRFAILSGLLSALRHLHTCGILHRDLKPSNIVLDASGQNPRVIDLGSGRRAGRDMTTGVYVTTYPYRAPEGVEGQTSYTNRIDCWSVGCILAEMITCKRMFSCQEDAIHRLHADFKVACSTATTSPGGAFPAQRAAGGLPVELEALDHLMDPNGSTRWSAEEALRAIGQADHHSRPTVQYSEPLYDVHHLSGMHRVIRSLCDQFAKAKSSATSSSASHALV